MFSLHGCSDPFDWSDPRAVSENDAGCLKILEENYNVGGIVGHGVEGLVFRAISTEHGFQVAIKVVERSTRTLQEMYTACLVDQRLAVDQRVFSRTYGWIACGMPPDSWSKTLNAYLGQEHGYPPKTLRDGSFYLVSELGNYSLKNTPLVYPIACASIVFEVLVALDWAWKTHGFIHGDLHCGNIVIRTQQARRYQVGSQEFLISDFQQPQIIDFADSTFDTPRPRSPDAARFIRSLQKNASKFSPEVASFIHESVVPLLDIEDMLMDSVFQPFRDKSTETVEVIKCHICGRPAAFQYSHAPSFGACSRGTCVDQLKSIGGIIKHEY